MIKFNIQNLEPGLILAGRDVHGIYGKAIRATLGSYTNHDGLIVYYQGQWYVAEAVIPKSRLTPLAEYEQKMNEKGYICRVWRVKNATGSEREKAQAIFINELLGLKYANYSIGKLAIFRLINNLPWRLSIKGVFCSELVWQAWTGAKHGILNRPDGKTKQNPTPRTLENRLVAGVLQDVTDSCIKT